MKKRQLHVQNSTRFYILNVDSKRMTFGALPWLDMYMFVARDSRLARNST